MKRMGPWICILPALLTSAWADSATRDIEQAARSLQQVQSQAAALSELAWATAVRGDAERAKTLAKAVLALEVPAGNQQTLRSHARAAGALILAGKAKLGLRALRRVLERVPGLKEPYERKNVLRAWWSAIPSTSQGGKELGGEGLKQVRALEPKLQASLLKEIAADLVRAGLLGEAKKLGSGLLATELPLLHFEDLLDGIRALYPDGLPAGTQEKVWSALRRAEPGSRDNAIDEFAPPMIAAVLGEKGNPAKAAEALAQEFAKAKLPYAALLVRYALVNHLADRKDKEQGAGQIQAVLNQAWAHERDGMERMRVLYRLYPLVPDLMAPKAALELLKAERERTLKRESTVYVLNELLGHLAQSAGKLEGDEASAFVETIQRDIAGLLRDARRRLRAGERLGSNPRLLLESLTTCAQSARALGSKRANAIVVRSAEIAIGELDQTGPDLGVFPLQTLGACAVVATRLGDHEKANAWLGVLGKHLANLGAYDRADVIQAVGDAAAGLKNPAQRTRYATLVAELVKTHGADARAGAAGDLFRAIGQLLQPGG